MINTILSEEDGVLTVSSSCGRTFQISSEDRWVLEYNWSSHKNGGKGYYISAMIDGRRVQLHRLLMRAEKHLFVDHINHNTSDNTRGNLRLCTNAENSRNQIVRPGFSSKYKGVFWHKRDKRWVAQIKKDGKQLPLGHFKVETEAAEAYNRAALELFGEFARVNVIE